MRLQVDISILDDSYNRIESSTVEVKAPVLDSDAMAIQVSKTVFKTIQSAELKIRQEESKSIANPPETKDEIPATRGEDLF